MRPARIAWDLVARIADRLPSRRMLRARFELQHARRFPLGSDGIVQGAQGIHLKADGPKAALLLHGFNDTPQSMAYLAAALHRAGWTVVAPRLPGHGVSLPVMAREARAANWQAAVTQAYVELREAHDTVVVCGQSMGGALAVLLASAHKDMPALVLLAPYLGMPRKIQLRVLASWLWYFARPYHVGTGGERSLHDPEEKAKSLNPGVITSRTMTELRRVALSAAAVLHRVKVPTLYLQSREDNRIMARDAERYFRKLGSREKVQRWVAGCGHIISADYCRDEVASQVIEWFARHVDGGAG